MSFSVVVRVYTTRDPCANPAEAGPRDSGVIRYSTLKVPRSTPGLRSGSLYSRAYPGLIRDVTPPVPGHRAPGTGPVTTRTRRRRGPRIGLQLTRRVRASGLRVVRGASASRAPGSLRGRYYIFKS